MLTAGLHLATQLLSALRDAPSSGVPVSGHPLLGTDPATGRRYLKLPLPDRGELDKLAEALKTLAAR